MLLIVGNRWADPPAAAGGTDCVQAGSMTFEAMSPANARGFVLPKPRNSSMLRIHSTDPVTAQGGVVFLIHAQ
jgi:hypothetical protein